MNTFTNSLSPSITSMIRMDHKSVFSTFHQYGVDTNPNAKRALVNSACLAIEIHAQLEEEIFYPALRAEVGEQAALDKSVPEHASIKQLIANLRTLEPTAATYDETFMQLMKEVMHHVADEETVLLPLAERVLKDRLGELGMQMTKRRLQLMAPHASEMAMNAVRMRPASTMLIAAGALLAGGYLLSRPRGRSFMATRKTYF